MIFVGLLSIFILKRKLELFRWAGMGVVLSGILLVGGADFMKTGSDNTIDMKAVTGDIIIVAAQVREILYRQAGADLCQVEGKLRPV